MPELRTEEIQGFNWNTFINDRAIVSFENERGINAKIGMNHYYVLSYIAQSCLNPKKYNKLINRYINGRMCIYMTTSFLLRNLKLLKVKKRTLGNILEDLEKNGYITRFVLNRNERYLGLSGELTRHFRPDRDLGYLDSEFELLVVKVGRIFGMTTKKQLKVVATFLDSINDLNYFEETLNYYVAYKDYTSDIRHGFDNFTEIWDERNWSLLLEQRKQLDLDERLKKLY